MFTGAKIKGPNADSGGWVLGEGAATPPHHLGERCELFQRGSGVDPTAQRFSTIFITQDGLSPDTIILLIVDYHAVIGGETPVPPHPLVYARASTLTALHRANLESAAELDCFLVWYDNNAKVRSLEELLQCFTDVLVLTACNQNHCKMLDDVTGQTWQVTSCG